MNIQDLFNSPVMKLPRDRNDEDFERYLNDHLGAYLSEVRTLDFHCHLCARIQSVEGEIAQLSEWIRSGLVSPDRIRRLRAHPRGCERFDNLTASRITAGHEARPLEVRLGEPSPVPPLLGRSHRFEDLADDDDRLIAVDKLLAIELAFVAL